ncbi:MAG: hypothetical protein U5J78_04730 [Parasphingorhabdus sp.]|nr:hypothetical protein [Parasphingorhabdus sp.]
MGSYFTAVRPMNIDAVEAAAERLRKILGINSDTRVRMINFIETVLLKFFRLSVPGYYQMKCQAWTVLQHSTALLFVWRSIPTLIFTEAIPKLFLSQLTNLAI